MTMNKLTSVLCATALLATAGSALAAKPTPVKQTICHNGSTYNLETMNYDPISFVITVSSNAVAKHVANHGDLEVYQEEEVKGQECGFVKEILVCKEVTLCKVTEQ
jgi:hypothetical protein